MSRKTCFSRIVPAVLLALAALAPQCWAGDFVYASTTATLTYPTDIGPIPITGLTINLPAATNAFNTAVVTLNMPNLFLTQSSSNRIVMTATLQIVAPFSTVGPVVALGSIGCDNANVATSGVKPITIVARIPLTSGTQMVEAEWFSNAVLTTQDFASLSAVMVKQ